jgi:chromosome segregation ATPase
VCFVNGHECVLTVKQNAMVAQAKQASERIAEAEQLRVSAVHEAAYYRAKVAALEAASEADLARVERDRVATLEKQLAALSFQRAEQDGKLARMQGEMDAQTALLSQTELRVADAAKRGDVLHESHERTAKEHGELRERHATLEASLRDHEARALSLNSQLEQKHAESAGHQAQLEDLTRSRDQHVRALEQARIAMEAASRRAEETDGSYQRSREQVSQLEGDVAELRGELEARTTEVESLRTRLVELENSWAKSREEADALRALTTTGLGELLDTHRDLKADEDRLTTGHADRLHAMETEAESLRALLQDSARRLEGSQSECAAERQRLHDAQAEQLAVGAQLSGVRAQLAAAVADSSHLRRELATKDAELRSLTRGNSEVTVRLGMLRNHLVENGIVLDENELSSPGAGPSARVLDLQNQLSELTRTQEDLEQELDAALEQKQAAETRLEQLSTELDRLREEHSQTNGFDEAVEARLEEAERKLEETEASYKARLQQLEEDYQLAVHYVK